VSKRIVYLMSHILYIYIQPITKLIIHNEVEHSESRFILQMKVTYISNFRDMINFLKKQT